MFWGLTMEPQKRYTQTVVDSFHISQAAIDVSTVKEESTPTQVMIEFENNSYLLASLSKTAKIYQVPLDLNFEKGDHVSFRTVGSGTVHLTGYHVFDDEDLEDRLMAEHEEESDEELDEETENSSFDDSAGNLRKRKKVTSSSGKNKKSKLDDSSDEDEEIDDFSSLGESTMLDLEAEESDGPDDDDDCEEIDEEESDEEAEDESDEEDSEDEENERTPAKKPVMNGNTSNKKAKGAAKTPEPASKGNAKKELNQSQQQTPKLGKTPKGEKTPKGDKAEKTPKSEKKTPKQEGATPKQEKGKKTPGGPSPGKKVLQGGLIAEDLKIGDGAVAKGGKMVQVYYVGKLKSNNKQFDAASNGPGFKFRLGRGEVIRGWDVGVEGMRVGGKRRLTIPAALAYGSKGSPPVIPPNATLLFDVELRNVEYLAKLMRTGNTETKLLKSQNLHSEGEATYTIELENEKLNDSLTRHGTASRSSLKGALSQILGKGK